MMHVAEQVKLTGSAVDRAMQAAAAVEQRMPKSSLDTQPPPCFGNPMIAVDHPDHPIQATLRMLLLNAGGVATEVREMQLALGDLARAAGLWPPPRMLGENPDAL